MVLSISIFYLRDSVADWELPLSSITRGVIPHITSPEEKKSQLKVQSTVSPGCVFPSQHHKV